MAKIFFLHFGCSYIAYRISRWCPVDGEHWGLELSQTKMREVGAPHASGMRCPGEGTEGQNLSQSLCDFLTFRRRQNQAF